MDSQSQLVRSQFHDQHGHSYEGDQSAAPTGNYQDEHHHEKRPSVLKKVKAKAKKLKDSLTKHGHTHDHDHDHDHDRDVIPDDHDLDQEEDDDEDEEVHGAPMYNSAGRFGTDVGRTTAAPPPPSTHHIPCTSLPLQENQILAQPTATIVNKAPPVVPYNTPAAPAAFSTTNYQRSRDSETDPTRTFLFGREDSSRVNLDRPRGGLEEDPGAPNRRHVAANYETKVTDPTRAGGEEVEVTPILKSFGKMSVHQESTGQMLDQNLPLNPQTQHDHYSNLPYTGTGNQNLFSQEAHQTLPIHHHDQTNQNLPIHHHDHYSNLPFTGTGTHDQFSPETHHHDELFKSNPPITGIDTSQNRFSTEPQQNFPIHQAQNQYSNSETGTGFGYCAEPKHNLSPVDETSNNQISDSPIGALEAFGSEQFLPIESEYSQPLPENDADMAADESGYTEKISIAITEKAIAAKNAVASKLGYGGNDDTAEQEMRDSSEEENVSTANKPVAATATEYGKKIAATVTDKLSPVYEKVAGAGSTVISKITPGSGEGAQDEGVTGSTEHFADKLKPGEEDRALSEVIAEALHKKKVETGKEEMEAAELEEVAERVRDGRPAGESGGGVVDKVKGAVGSWLGMGDQSHGNEQGEIGGEMGDGGGGLRR